MAAQRAILVLNAGSSSLKYALFTINEQLQRAMQGVIEQIGTAKSTISHTNLEATSTSSHSKGPINAPDYRTALENAIEHMGLNQRPLVGVGHRVVHGGDTLTSSTLITPEVKSLVEKWSSLAPLHNPANLLGIKVSEELFPCPQVAVIDTAFHSSLPQQAFMYGLPMWLYKELHIRRYGFHGTSYLYLTRETARLLGKPQEDVNLVICHLGAGASMAVVKNGKSVDTTMGVTPLEGLVMATRSGDVDPSVYKILADQKGMTPSQVDTMLNKQSGLLGLAGTADMRSIAEGAENGQEECEVALKVWVHRVRRYLGAYLLQLGGKMDALVFSGGVGERSSPVRRLVCEDLAAFGIELDEQKNSEKAAEAREIQTKASKFKVMVVPTDEELCIAQETLRVIETAKEE